MSVVDAGDFVWSDIDQCPECGAEYPEFYAPTGSTRLICTRCGWTTAPQIKRKTQEEPWRPN